MMRKVSTPLLSVLFCLSILLLFGLMSVIGPSDLGVGGIFLVLAAVYMVFFIFFVLISRLTEIMMRSPREKNMENATKIAHVRRRNLLISAVLAFAPLFLISMNSLGQMQPWYIAMVVLFEAVVILFIVKRV